MLLLLPFLAVHNFCAYIIYVCEAFMCSVAKKQPKIKQNFFRLYLSGILNPVWKDLNAEIRIVMFALTLKFLGKIALMCFMS